MNATHFCEHCGATLAPDALFCEACGRSVAAPVASAEQLAAPLAAPPAATPRPANRGLIVGLAIVGVLVVLGCLAVGVFGFWFLQSKPAVTSQLSAGTPEVAGMPTRGEPTVGSSRATTPPVQTVATGAPTLMPTLVPGVLFDDDFSSKATSEGKGWSFTANPQVEASWSANQLSMSIKQNDFFIRKFPSVEYEDFSIETEAQFVSGAYAEDSLIFRDNRADKARAFYAFGITTDGRYFLRKTVDDKEVSPRLIDYTSSPLIKTGQSRNTLGVIVKGSRITGVQTAQGEFHAPVVVNAAGAWAGKVNEMAGLEVPYDTWRHDTMFVACPRQVGPEHPTVIDFSNEMYFRPDAGNLTLVGLEDGNPLGESPDNDTDHAKSGFVERGIDRICKRLPVMENGSLHSAHGGDDGITPDQHPMFGPIGPDGFYLDCGHSGTGFKISPAVGLCMSELILDGKAKAVDISIYRPQRFAEGKLIVGEHPYSSIWK